MNYNVETILIYTILAGILSIVYGYFTGKNILAASTGNSKMQEIASAIQIGAKAYLNRQYKTIAIVGLVVLVIISFSFSFLVGLGYLIGAALSGIAGYVGMLVSVQANVRTAEASRKGLSKGLYTVIEFILKKSEKLIQNKSCESNNYYCNKYIFKR